MISQNNLHPNISVIIPVFNGTDTLNRCLAAVYSSDYSEYACIVVDDGSTDGSQSVAKEFAATVCELKGGPYGPAHARNQGAKIANGKILFFIDADVVIRPDTLTKVADTFDKRPHITALFGSYDESPAGAEFLTQYKNLVHHFVHQQGQEDAGTFWTGCGAIRRDVFLEMGGFDKERYPQPSIEDIELGYRLKAAGHDIFLNKEIQVKHLKKWSLKGLVKTDVFNRALPWTQLIMQEGNLPNDLNLQTSQRSSAFLLCLLLLWLTITIFQKNAILLPLLTGLFLLVVNGWHWRDEPTIFKMGREVEAGIYLFILVIGFLAFINQLMLLLVPSALLFLMILAGRFLLFATPFQNKVLFVAMMISLASAFIIVILSYPIWLILPILLILALIVLLNQQLYLFFIRKRGFIFTLAVLPLQLFYYFYSVITFVVSSGLHIWNSKLRSNRS